MSQYILGILLILAMAIDIKTKRIPNSFLIVLYLLGACIEYYKHGAEVVVVCAMAVLLIIILFPTYMIGAFGAGDIKLFGAMSLFIGFIPTLTCFYYSLLICGSVSIFILCFERIRKSGRKRKHYVSYTIFIFLGYVFTLWNKR